MRIAHVSDLHFGHHDAAVAESPRRRAQGPGARPADRQRRFHPGRQCRRVRAGPPVARQRRAARPRRARQSRRPRREPVPPLRLALWPLQALHRARDRAVPRGRRHRLRRHQHRPPHAARAQLVARLHPPSPAAGARRPFRRRDPRRRPGGDRPPPAAPARDARPQADALGGSVPTWRSRPSPASACAWSSPAIST